VGDAHISTVDINAHTMMVTSNGQVVQTFKDSAGRDKYPSMGGVHIVQYKQPDVLMDSQSVGIPRNSPDGYYEHVAEDVNISDGGEFVHSAPWSVGAQGNSNVSHGCVNLAPSDATWFFNFSQRGDIVNIVNSPRPPDLGDGGTVDWNTSWDKWVAGSALPVT
jgi:lipoprotein-anchoring transpeptidase ErfK/SrfK